ncbi:hypothetical protein J8F10_22645 [Gemmata sp. G18]|uniref:Clp R domain-containing protein n=1 Tax=Gemmata palustris TaxID=2822762 RepID=A0ABS5BXD5_9BACT|nr:hypothetical protein [Gemmata palustris]MBP3958062.1 hypothetical protein [Gemmata palustris]
MGFLLRQYAIDANKVKRELDAALNRLKTGNTSAPGLSTNILSAVREAWVFGSLELGASQVRSAHLLYAMLADDNMGEQLKRVGGIRPHLEGETRLRHPRPAPEYAERGGRTGSQRHRSGLGRWGRYE